MSENKSYYFSARDNRAIHNLLHRDECKAEHWLDPTPEMLASPEFEAVWQCIKSWDINVPEAYDGYMGAIGNHVCMILNALYSIPTRGKVAGDSLHFDSSDELHDDSHDIPEMGDCAHCQQQLDTDNWWCLQGLNLCRECYVAMRQDFNG